MPKNGWGFLSAQLLVVIGIILYQQEVSDETNDIPVMQSMLRQVSVKEALFRRGLLNLLTGHPLKGIVTGKMIGVGRDNKFRAEILFG